MIVIVAGVAGCGKTTVGSLVAERLHCQFADADAFHNEANVAKMHAGIPLTDEDRKPWLHALGAWMDGLTAAGQSGVVTCSALKREYRDFLLTGRPAAILVFLQVSREVLDQRLTARHGHFFPEKLLDSQLQTLEPPAPDEKQVRTVLAEGGPAHVADQVIAAVWPDGEPTEPLPGTM